MFLVTKLLNINKSIIIKSYLSGVGDESITPAVESGLQSAKRG